MEYRRLGKSGLQLSAFSGTSQWPAEQISEAYALAERHHLTPPTMEQPEYNMFVRDNLAAIDVLPQLKADVVADIESILQATPGLE